MKNISLLRLVIGIGIIMVGLLALLGEFGVINFAGWFSTYWPLLFIAGGLAFWADNPRQNYIWSIIIICLGIVAQLNALDIVNVGFWQLFWPAILIVFGWSVLVNRAENITSEENVTAFLSGATNKSNSKDYKGGKVTAILGGSELDLRKAAIKQSATIEVLAVMGGIEIRVPEGWDVRASVTPILGGTDNKTAVPSNSKAPVLNVVGTVMMGGVDIKN
jgi:hypothetical protein